MISTVITHNRVEGRLEGGLEDSGFLNDSFCSPRGRMLFRFSEIKRFRDRNFSSFPFLNRHLSILSSR